MTRPPGEHLISLHIADNHGTAAGFGPGWLTVMNSPTSAFQSRLCDSSPSCFLINISWLNVQRIKTFFSLNDSFQLPKEILGDMFKKSRKHFPFHNSQAGVSVEFCKKTYRFATFLKREKVMSRTAEPVLSHEMLTRCCHHANILRQQYDLSTVIWKKRKWNNMIAYNTLRELS